jgi:hypothetical protein
LFDLPIEETVKTRDAKPAASELISKGVEIDDAGIEKGVSFQ